MLWLGTDPDDQVGCCDIVIDLITDLAREAVHESRALSTLT